MFIATDTVTSSGDATADGGSQLLPFALSASGPLDSAGLDGVIQYSTPVAYAGEVFDDPSSGTMPVQGLKKAHQIRGIM